MYPAIYHRARAALIHANDAPGTRKIVAEFLRYTRKHSGRLAAVSEAAAIAFIGWPVRKRSNGRYR